MIIVPLRITAGFLLVALGVIGLVMPIMPGLIFLIPGLALLSRHFHWAHRMHTQLCDARRFCWNKVKSALLAKEPRTAMAAVSAEGAEEQAIMTA